MEEVLDRQAAGLGDASWEDLYRTHYAPLVRLAGLLLGDYGAGEEIAQDAFARLLETRASISDQAAYVRGIVVNLCRSRIRRAVLVRRHRSRQTADLPGPENEVDRINARLALHGALARLPRRQREALVLRFYAELSEPEIAAAMKVSVGTVKTHLHRAMNALSERMEELR
jgi:RNA polymerase sigma-70 factor (sigma-E family)